MAGVVHIPWYATVFRGNQMEAALAEIAPLSLRYGASEYLVYRAREDMYRFLQLATFEDKDDFESYWYGPDFSTWRADHAGWYQVPVVYAWNDLVVSGALEAGVRPAPAEPS